MSIASRTSSQLVELHCDGRRRCQSFMTAQGSIGYRLDIVVGNCIVVEVKAIDSLTRLHEAQVLTYLKLSGCRLGFLMNFNVILFKQGLRRLVL